jgi:phosphoribosylformylglycinamidine synthase
VAEVNESAARQLLQSAGVPFVVLGEVGGDRLVVEGALELPVAELEATWERTIPAAMSS